MMEEKTSGEVMVKYCSEVSRKPSRNTKICWRSDKVLVGGWRQGADMSWRMKVAMGSPQENSVVALECTTP